MQSISLKKNKEVLKDVFQYYDRKDLTIDCVLEGTMCEVFANCQNSPTIFLIKNGPFYILGGDYKHSHVSKLVDFIPDGATILPSPVEWISILKNHPNVGIEKQLRYSLNHENISIAHLSDIIASLSSEFEVRKIDDFLVNEISSSSNFKYHLQNFKSATDFINRGIGYAIINQGIILGVASSALVSDKGVEINIMVLPEYRGNSLGKVLAAKFTKAILSKNKIPNWDAGNEISLNLAKRLGYELVSRYQVHRVLKT